MPTLPPRLQALRSSSVLRYGLTNLLPRSVAILITLIVTPLAISRLGLLEYGVWALATLVPNLVPTPDLGLTNGVVNEVARTHQRDGHLRSERGRLLGLKKLLGLIAIVWLALGAGGLAVYTFAGGASDVAPLKVYTALLLALAIFVVGIPPTLWNKAQLAQERGHEYLAWEGVGKVTSLVASVLVLLLVPNLYLLIIATMLPSVIASLINGWRYQRSELGPAAAGEPSMSLRQIIQQNRAVFSAGKFFVLFQVAFLLGTAMDPFIIKNLLGTRDVAYLTLARRPFEALPLVVTLFSTALWPVFYRLNAANQVGEVKRLLLRIGGGTVLLLALLSGAILLFSGPIYRYLGNGAVNIRVGDLLWIALSISAVTLVIICNNYLNAMHLLRQQAFVQVGAAVTGLVCKVISLRVGGLPAYFATAAVVYFTLALLPSLWLTLQHLQLRQRQAAEGNTSAQS
ncbi:lipopolysaccharide biosynthesis protein [Deinococcus arenicola]|uniref:Oligosaccharide flippase family protein n=1 Tax=Deinococcus arenicola TaxID=2994950 RepID=A0ABU4DVZ3_9DEIO|nr:oligosaccharide flippase family protein [Deinococcus sp. ZS9-10]MDV6376025.1 oligosaccharide flippase family protein [Deinococcus sp. ZS9-10]